MEPTRRTVSCDHVAAARGSFGTLCRFRANNCCEAIYETMTDFFSLIARIPGHVLALWAAWFLVTAGLVFYTSRALGPGEPAVGSGQSIQVTGSPNTNVYQAGRDINLIQDPKTIRNIQSVTVEARLTCTMKPGAAVPPGEVNFVPVGDSHAYLEAPTGRTRLSFVSPVRFRLLGTDRVTTVNQFSLDPASGIQNRPIDALVAFDTLSVPIVTIVYGAAFDRITLLEVTVFVNGDAVWYGSWRYDRAFQQPRFGVTLDNFKRRIRG